MTRSSPFVVVVAMLTAVLAACGGGEVAEVDGPDLQASVAPLEPDDPDEPDEPAPSPSPSAEDEPTEEAAPPTFEAVCAGRDDEAFIEVLTPQPGALVTDPVTITGCGNTFEATYLYRLEAVDGTVLVEDFGTMSCGNGCVGEFTFEVEAGTTGEVLLTVFEESAKDGAAQHVVEVPLTIG